MRCTMFCFVGRGVGDIFTCGAGMSWQVYEFAAVNLKSLSINKVFIIDKFEFAADMRIIIWSSPNLSLTNRPKVLLAKIPRSFGMYVHTCTIN